MHLRLSRTLSCSAIEMVVKLGVDSGSRYVLQH